MRIRWRNLELPTQVVLDEETATKNYGRFTVEPFERGFGTTIGNSLRRVLLSSLEGTAVTHVKIDGVQHEFSTIKGVFEDVTTIILNLKNLLLKIDTEEKVVLKLDKKKHVGPITAADLEHDHHVEIVNPDLHLANCTEKANLALEIHATRGRGYVPAEENESEESEIGLIPVDSIFTPVHRVRFRTEDTRVGKLTNYDKLILEIWTDGTLSPEMAQVEAAKILRRHLSPFIMQDMIGKELQRRQEVKKASQATAERAMDEVRKKLQQSIDGLDLSVRARNCIDSESMATVGDLCCKDEDELLSLRNFGKTSLREIKKKLSDQGLSLGMDVSQYMASN